MKQRIRLIVVVIGLTGLCPIAASSDVDEAKCDLIRWEGDVCVEYAWLESSVGSEPKEVRSSTRCKDLFTGDYVLDGVRLEHGCECSRHAYQDFGIFKRVNYYWCKARY